MVVLPFPGAPYRNSGARALTGGPSCTSRSLLKVRCCRARVSHAAVTSAWLTWARTDVSYCRNRPGGRQSRIFGPRRREWHGFRGGGLEWWLKGHGKKPAEAALQSNLREAGFLARAGQASSAGRTPK